MGLNVRKLYHRRDINLSQVASFGFVLKEHMQIHFEGCKVVSVGKAQSQSQAEIVHEIKPLLKGAN